MKKNGSRQNGFTLTEILIVIVMITIISAITVPYLRRAIVTANEASAVSAMRVISQAQNQKGIGGGQYVSLSQLQREGFLDDRFEGVDINSNEASTGGYDYLMTLIDPTDPASGNYVLSAKPTHTAPVIFSGTRRYGLSKSGAIYYDINDLDNHFTTPVQVEAGLPLGN